MTGPRARIFPLTCGCLLKPLLSRGVWQVQQGVTEQLDLIKGQLTDNLRLVALSALGRGRERRTILVVFRSWADWSDYTSYRKAVGTRAIKRMRHGLQAKVWRSWMGWAAAKQVRAGPFWTILFLHVAGVNMLQALFYVCLAAAPIRFDHAVSTLLRPDGGADRGDLRAGEGRCRHRR